MSAANLSGKIEMLPPYKRQEVSDFVDFLLSSVNFMNKTNNIYSRKRPYAGCMSGTFGKISDDFNEQYL